MKTENLITEIQEVIRKSELYAKDLGMSYVTSSHVMLIILRGYKEQLDKTVSPYKCNYDRLTQKLLERMYRKDMPSNIIFLDGCMHTILKIINTNQIKQLEEFIAIVMLYGDIPISYYGLGKDGNAFLEKLRQSYSVEKLTSEKKQIISEKQFAYCENVTSLAKEGLLSPVYGRTKEIEEMITILLCKKKNNLILLGEAGVGKTAIVEALAQAIVQGQVPKTLENSTVLSFNLASMVAGTSNRGEFEERLQNLIESVQKEKNTVILFIDEIHTILGVGSEGNLDFSNIIKPALARGSLHCIGATTYSEYKKTIEKDKALVRRFQNIHISEPDEQEVLSILNKLKPEYESYHHVRYQDDAIRACVSLSNQYIYQRHMPDKAIDLMDEAGAYVNKNNLTFVDTKYIALLVEKKTGIPVNLNPIDNNAEILEFERKLHEKVVGQDIAVNELVNEINYSRLRSLEEKRPRCVLWFGGPENVGITSTIQMLTEHLFKDKTTMYEFSMSEYQEKHTISKLIGSPPGYSGSQEGGMLTELVKNNPFCLLVFNDIEFAHDTVKNLLVQIIKRGYISDSLGNNISFCNTIIILNSKRGIKYKPGFFGKGSVYLEKNHKNFNTNLIETVDKVIVFQYLNQFHIQKIMDIKLAELTEKLRNENVELIITDSVTKYILKESTRGRYHTTKPLMSYLHKYIIQPLYLEKSKCQSAKKFIVSFNKRTGNTKIQIL